MRKPYSRHDDTLDCIQLGQLLHLVASRPALPPCPSERPSAMVEHQPCLTLSSCHDQKWLTSPSYDLNQLGLANFLLILLTVQGAGI